VNGSVPRAIVAKWLAASPACTQTTSVEFASLSDVDGQAARMMLLLDEPGIDNLPKGGQGAIHRILFNDGGVSKTLLQLIKEKNTEQGEAPAGRADLRVGQGPGGQIFVLNKRDGAIRLLVR